MCACITRVLYHLFLLAFPQKHLHHHLLKLLRNRMNELNYKSNICKSAWHSRSNKINVKFIHTLADLLDIEKGFGISPCRPPPTPLRLLRRSKHHRSYRSFALPSQWPCWPRLVKPLWQVHVYEPSRLTQREWEPQSWPDCRHSFTSTERTNTVEKGTQTWGFVS